MQKGVFFNQHVITSYSIHYTKLYDTWEGVLKFYKKYEGYLQGQIGNPEGEDKPNKKYYDPRKWLREAEVSMVNRLKVAFEDLNALDRN